MTDKCRDTNDLINALYVAPRVQRILLTPPIVTRPRYFRSPHSSIASGEGSASKDGLEASAAFTQPSADLDRVSAETEMRKMCGIRSSSMG